jgi:transcriptional regulator with XRE-family HTH domain
VAQPKSPLKRWIVEQREAKGWEAWDLAEKLGVTYSTVRGWEAASGGNPAPKNIEVMERLFGVTSPITSGAAANGDAVAAAIERQTAALDRQTDMLERMLGEIRDAFQYQGGQVEAVLGVVTRQQTDARQVMDDLYEEARQRRERTSRGRPPTPEDTTDPAHTPGRRPSRPGAATGARE